MRPSEAEAATRTVPLDDAERLAQEVMKTGLLFTVREPSGKVYQVFKDGSISGFAPGSSISNWYPTWLHYEGMSAHPGTTRPPGTGLIGAARIVEAGPACAAPAVLSDLHRVALVGQKTLAAIAKFGDALCVGARRRIELKLGLPNTFLSAKSFYLRFKYDYLCLKLCYLRFQVLSIGGFLKPICKEPISLYYKRLSIIWKGYPSERVVKFSGHRRSS